MRRAKRFSRQPGTKSSLCAWRCNTPYRLCHRMVLARSFTGRRSSAHLTLVTRHCTGLLPPNAVQIAPRACQVKSPVSFAKAGITCVQGRVTGVMGVPVSPHNPGYCFMCLSASHVSAEPMPTSVALCPLNPESHMSAGPGDRGDGRTRVTSQPWRLLHVGPGCCLLWSPRRSLGQKQGSCAGSQHDPPGHLRGMLPLRSWGSWTCEHLCMPGLLHLFVSSPKMPAAIMAGIGSCARALHDPPGHL